MEKILLLSQQTGDTPEQIRKAFPKAECMCTNSVEDTLAIIENDNISVSAILADTPSRLKNIRQLLGKITDGNNYVHSISIIILTDENSMEQDIEYLGGAAVDIVTKPINPIILANRLRNAKQLINSVSFSEFARMLKVLPANIYLKDAKGRYVFSSQTWHHLDTGDDPDWTIRGKTDIEIRKDKENARLAMKSDAELLRTGKGTSYIIEENAGEQEFLQLIKEPLFYPDGRIRGIIALINNVTEQELLRRELKERSIHDQMTGLYNRTYLDEYILELKKKEEFPISIISADCDCLKKVNDTYGHMAGDMYIRMCVDLMCGEMPEKSGIFRIGGDEFMAFLPQTDEETAEKIIENMRRRAPSFRVHDTALSISFGFSTVTDMNTSIVDCIKISDSDMYRDKKRKKAERR
ncbi:MAG: diguanylate cyclase [Ruminococcus sp.]|nr:diguanylate cyclase [Ruminococcus sp.]